MKTHPLVKEAERREDVWGNGGVALCILNLGTRWRWVVSYMLQPLYPRCPLDVRLSVSQNWFGHSGGGENVA